MSRAAIITRLARQISQLTVNRTSVLTCSYSTDVQHSIPKKSDAGTIGSFGDRFSNKSPSSFAQNPIGGECKPQVGENVSRKDKISFLVNTLLDLNDSKEAVYGALDAWVAWERTFPIGPLKQVLLKLEKEQQWHRIVQVIKWMLSKGQGNTMGTYEQLIKALDMDHRAKEAHEFWNKKIGCDLHSVPWRLCSLMISVYYRNHMLEDLTKLFKGLEAFDRKPPEKSIVQKVADTYEVLGFVDEKDRVLEKYKDLFTETWDGNPKGLRGSRSQRKQKQAQEN
ncbi:pentatricopeptide repeat-containing protein At4g21190 [Lycium barbarum]|uniref:pentatricopeptide repeat-containing protein At4g21190 n=1 Tax=Lycium barbarum TaxID=112863 RepID=UPI00293EE8C6|nr:pentatricopeptide repeat-containing protein At4g21190 [Lycium barbarum]XP_060185302.1 pentatricopeptide repeat-containing protein At4g21190 [Lycium barbarum]XP_060185303.1 pentatricopeptide repeat-containing protein At4g21190 [Lycium barbarum]XP_060185304.1 pentatricopeptide repeat-containing protein At4g21190 [Lycium barbarum]XP_060185305.1 pentatricopeptide repeat-containing protein At4g21190 [Lycium barbarum]XP_060185306.1 pentatricopeptide repeat-containing protein At4g21190 [Lycium bar